MREASSTSNQGNEYVYPCIQLFKIVRRRNQDGNTRPFSGSYLDAAAHPELEFNLNWLCPTRCAGRVLCQTLWQVGNCFLTVGEHSEIKGQAKEPARIILNLETTAVKAEFERLKPLGVTVIKEPYRMGDEGWIATLADLDGNFVQLMTPFEM